MPKVLIENDDLSDTEKYYIYIMKRYMRDLVKPYFGLLKIQVKF